MPHPIQNLRTSTQDHIKEPSQERKLPLYHQCNFATGTSMKYNSPTMPLAWVTRTSTLFFNDSFVEVKLVHLFIPQHEAGGRPPHAADKTNVRRPWALDITPNRREPVRPLLQK